MGKPFANELEKLQETLAWVEAYDVTALAEFFSKTKGECFISIGAGGSFTVAELLRLLCEARGDMAQAHTPLSFLQCQTDLRSCNVVLFTAGGNNRDTLAAYLTAVEREAKHVLVVCGSLRSKVAQLARDYPRSQVFGLPLPAGKDGYLATNSLLAFAALTIRACGFPNLSSSKLEQIQSRLEVIATDERSLAPYFLMLYSGWGRVAAVDFESKFYEAGLGAVQLADYRQFGHGRHNWIDKQGRKTTVIAVVTPEATKLAQKTLRLLPRTVRAVQFTSDETGPAGALELLLCVFYYTAIVGKRRGIDPGRPGVPDYGSRLYQLGPLTRSAHKPDNAAARDVVLRRKLAARVALDSADDRGRVSVALDAFLQRIRTSSFGALVCDFDGTVVGSGAVGIAIAAPLVAFFSELLRRRIPLYFATGRGDSIHDILRASFSADLLAAIVVFYYNGAFALPMADADRFEAEKPHYAVLDAVFAALQGNERLRHFAEPKHNGCQITVKIKRGASATFATRLLTEIVGQVNAPGVRVLYSSHSIDVLPTECSKLNAIRRAIQVVPQGREVLTLGDRGAYPGNDFELLTHPCSLSVDTVSSALDSCWNLLPAGVRNVAGLQRYVSMMEIGDDTFRFNPPMERAP